MFTLSILSCHKLRRSHYHFGTRSGSGGVANNTSFPAITVAATNAGIGAICCYWLMTSDVAYVRHRRDGRFRRQRGRDRSY